MSGNFADSNVLLYLQSEAPKKADIVERILVNELCISVQVLNEIANVMIRKWRLSWRETEDFLILVRRVTRVVPITAQIHHLGIVVAKRHQTAIYDSMIIAAAIDAECDVLYSEDMQHGMVIEKQLRIVNPFLDA